MAIGRALCLFALSGATVALDLEFPVKPIKELVKSTAKPLQAADQDLTQKYPAHTISIPIDHFPDEPRYEPHSDEKFDLRYWYDDTYYEEGGPVIVLHGGETDGEGRLPFLEHGIVSELANATRGLGVIMEHRYYGESMPTKDLSTESLRFLTTEQALADSAYFAKNVRFEGLDKDLTAPGTPWIAYGGSYAGGQVAFLRVEYPDIFWGTISSSGVVTAIYDYWEYFEPIRKEAPQDCVEGTQTFVDMFDTILIDKNDDEELTALLKDFFLLGDLTHTDDFVNLLASGITGWQGTNWDPAISSPSFSRYCGNITTVDLLYPVTPERKANAEKIVKAGGGDPSVLTNPLLNYAGWINATSVYPCTSDGQTLDECFGNHDPNFYKQDDIEQTWRCWPYQFCTEWGYLQTGSGAPENIQTLVSRLITLEYTTTICREAFGIHSPPDTERVNKYGAFDIEYDRLAFIDGSADPWREATVHSSHARDRESTKNKPFILIQDAVHHWDENGVFPNQTTPDFPPKRIQKVKQQEIKFVQKWLEEWEKSQDKQQTR